MQAVCAHQNVAVATALFPMIANIDGAVGSAVSCAIWSNLLPGKLVTGLVGMSAAGHLHQLLYGDGISNGPAREDLQVPMIPLGSVMRIIGLRTIYNILHNAKGLVVGGQGCKRQCRCRYGDER